MHQSFGKLTKSMKKKLTSTLHFNQIKFESRMRKFQSPNALKKKKKNCARDELTRL